MASLANRPDHAVPPAPPRSMWYRRQLVRVESLRRGDDDAVILQRIVQLGNPAPPHLRVERVEIERRRKA